MSPQTLNGSGKRVLRLGFGRGPVERIHSSAYLDFFQGAWARWAEHGRDGDLLPEMMREFSEYRMLMFGAMMVLMMIWRPQGLLPMQRPHMEQP